MKRAILLLLILLFLAGCDLRNRQSSEDFIPTGTYRADEPAASRAEGGDPYQMGESSVVKTVLSYAGEQPLGDRILSYSFQLPMIDLGGAQAMGCNQEIEDRFGTLIRQSMEAMERFEQPALVNVRYSSYVCGQILTLRVDSRDPEGNESSAFYTVNAETGEAVSVSELFAAAGVSGQPETVLHEAVEALFVRRYGAGLTAGADSPYRTAWFNTEEALKPLTANRMHLTEDGRLIVAVELFDLLGGSSIEELILP
jgi:hypothetical protein